MVFNLFLSKCDKCKTNDPATNDDNTSNTSSSSTTSNAPSSSVSSECSIKNCTKNEIVIYLLIALLFILLFLFSLFLHVRINRLTDESVFRENIKSDFVTSEMRKVVKGVLKEIKFYQQPSLPQPPAEGYEMFMDMQG